MAGIKATMMLGGMVATGGFLGYFQQNIVDWLESGDRNHSCANNDACAQFRFNREKRMAGIQSTGYSLDKDSIVATPEDATLYAVLNSDGTNPDTEASLQMYLQFLEDGVLRTYITKDGSEFRVSSETLPVNPDLAIATGLQFHVSDTSITVDGLTSSFGDETFSYLIDFDGFQISQLNSSGSVTAVVNNDQSLFVQAQAADEEEVYGTLISSFFKKTNWGSYFDSSLTEISDATEGVGLSVWYPTDVIFGLGEREDTLVLEPTTGGEPLELFAHDNPHEPNSPATLYGQLPIVTGISSTIAQAFYWVNTAHSWVFIDQANVCDNSGREISFVSESGALEFFLFSSSAKTSSRRMNRAKRIQQKIHDLTGPAFLPPLHTLGFHYSKYAPASSDILRERNAKFSSTNFPVDVLWMDIQWADKDGIDNNYQYFQFNPQNFTTDGIAAMNQEVEDAGRFITVILDPHIQHNDDYFVFAEGEDFQSQVHDDDGGLINVFVKDADSDDDFVGTCWPGDSVWVDFLNEKAQEYWGNLYGYTKFVGSSKIYHAWNDMNEPSVFDGPLKTIPGMARHFKADGRTVYHRDIHNAYGAFQQRSSYYGILKRDDNTRRPFVLTRSFFIGSQKYGAYWTGDNYTEDAEPYGAMKMILSNSLVGAVNGGSDVPGFIGNPTDELYVRFYQLGAWMPFFRAHCDINSQDRDPWDRSDRVQAVIRDAINRRYDLMHYIYTTVWQTSQTGEPLMRTMWSEFPDDTTTYTIDTQFMFGKWFMVAPKITAPTSDLESQQKQSVTYTLPRNSQWYNSNNLRVVGTGQPVTEELDDLDQAVFILGGAIIPTLLHDGCLAISKCIDAPIRLTAYMDMYGHSEGELYLDDGISLDYQTDGYQKISYDWSESRLTVSASEGSWDSGKVVDEIIIHGYGGLGPIAVTQGGFSTEWSFVPGTLTVKLDSVPVTDINLVVTMMCAEEPETE